MADFENFSQLLFFIGYMKWPGLIKVGRSTQCTLPLEKEAKSSRARATPAEEAQDVHPDQLVSEMLQSEVQLV